MSKEPSLGCCTGCGGPLSPSILEHRRLLCAIIEIKDVQALDYSRSKRTLF